MSSSNIEQPRNNIPEKYPNLFREIGCLSGEHHFNLAPEALPRKVPYLLKEKFKAELDRMERNEISDKADEPTDWVSSQVIVERTNGKLRICLDPHDVNKGRERESITQCETLNPSWQRWLRTSS